MTTPMSSIPAESLPGPSLTSTSSRSREATPSSTSSQVPLQNRIPILEPRKRTASSVSADGDMDMDGSSGSASGSQGGLGSSHSTTITLGADSPSQDGSGASASGSGSGSGSQDIESAERFLKKLEMEKKMQALQQRLELASMKATNGWTDLSIGEIETKLTPKSARRGSQLTIDPTPRSPTAAQHLVYEPPSPSRPWSLIDVLWQPLPPPSHGRIPPSPSSPRKRNRGDFSGEPGPSFNRSPSSLSIGQFPPNAGLGLPITPASHRRASSAAAFGFLQQDPHLHPRLASPLRALREGDKKRRSLSHSHPARPSNTSQDVDAAKALAFMLGSAREESASPTSSTFNSALHAPLLSSAGSTSLPIPEASGLPTGPRPRAQSIASPERPKSYPPLRESPMASTGAGAGVSDSGSSGSRSQTPRSSRAVREENEHEQDQEPDMDGQQGRTLPGAEDKSAAELMMFLAHSPSPLKRVAPAPARSVGSAARVLFADPDPGRVVNHSNLAMAPPILPEGVKLSPAFRQLDAIEEP